MGVLTTPDGATIEVPDGATADQVGAIFAARESQKKEASFQGKNQEQADDMGWYKKYMAGVGSSAVGMARRVGNLAYDPIDQDSFFSRSKIAEQDRMDKALKHTFWGGAGHLSGDMAMAAPVGPGVRALAEAAPVGAGVLSKALGYLSGPGAQAASSGAVTSLLTSDPGERGEEALKGAVTGGVLQKALSAGGRISSGLVQKSDAAKDLEHAAAQQGENIDIPAAQAAGDQDMASRVAKIVYKDALPYIPTVGGRLQGQKENMQSQIRKLALNEATPTGTTLPANSSEDTAQALPVLKSAFDKGYKDTVGTLDFLTPKPGTIETAIKKAMPNIDDTSLSTAVSRIEGTISRYASGKPRIEGENLLNAKNDISLLIRGSHGAEKQALVEGQKAVENLIQTRLSGQGLKDQYTELSEPYRNFLAVSKAVQKSEANMGNFTPRQLVSKANRGTATYELGTAGNQVLKGTGAPSGAGRIVVGAALGGLGIYSPAGVATGVGVGHLLANPSTQRVLLGNTQFQKAISKALADNPELLKSINDTLRNAAVVKEGD